MDLLDMILKQVATNNPIYKKIETPRAEKDFYGIEIRQTASHLHKPILSMKESKMKGSQNIIITAESITTVSGRAGTSLQKATTHPDSAIVTPTLTYLLKETEHGVFSGKIYNNSFNIIYHEDLPKVIHNLPVFSKHTPWEARLKKIEENPEKITVKLLTSNNPSFTYYYDTDFKDCVLKVGNIKEENFETIIQIPNTPEAKKALVKCLEDHVDPAEKEKFMEDNHLLYISYDPMYYTEDNKVKTGYTITVLTKPNVTNIEQTVNEIYQKSTRFQN